MKLHHDSLAIYSFQLSELQTENPFLIGFDTVEEEGRTLLEVAMTLIGADGDDSTDDGCVTRTFYLDVSEHDASLREILEHRISPKQVRELFNDMDELEYIESFVNEKVLEVLSGDIRIDEFQSQEMLVSIEAEFDIDLSEEAEQQILSSVYFYFH